MRLPPDIAHPGAQIIFRCFAAAGQKNAYQTERFYQNE
jgi:hypothetical protein